MYHVEWIVENRLILFRAVGDQTLETLEDGVDRLNQHINAGTEPVHVITDMRYIGDFPTSLSAIKKLLQQNDMSGQTISVGGNSLSKFVSTMLTKISGGGQLEFQDSVGEAVHYLQQIDTSLPADINFTEAPVDDSA